MPWKVDLRTHDGRLSERLLTEKMSEAESWFRKLLARDDLAGEPVAARVVSPITNTAIYFSRFDDERRRIHPEAPLNLLREDDGTYEACQWRPTMEPQTEFDAAWEAQQNAFEKLHGLFNGPDLDESEIKVLREAYIKASHAFHQAAERLQRAQ